MINEKLCRVKDTTSRKMLGAIKVNYIYICGKCFSIQTNFKIQLVMPDQYIHIPTIAATIKAPTFQAQCTFHLNSKNAFELAKLTYKTHFHQWSLSFAQNTPRKTNKRKYQCKIIAEVCGAMLEIIQKVKQKCQQLQFWGHTEPG